MRNALCLALLGLLISWPAHGENLADRDWSAAFASNPPLKEDVESLVNKALQTDWDMKLCSYVFVDLGHDQNYRLLATLDVNGRHACNRLVVIGKKDGKVLVINDFTVDDVDNVRDDFRDDPDGALLAFSGNWELYEGAGCKATWVYVYQWHGDRFVDRSKTHLGIYQGRLEQLKSVIPRAPEPICLQMEADRIARFLGSDPTAGFSMAVTWMHDPKGPLRRKAAAVFADIGDAESKKNLATLENDADPLVAEAARVYRDRMRGDSKE